MNKYRVLLPLCEEATDPLGSWQVWKHLKVFVILGKSGLEDSKSQKLNQRIYVPSYNRVLRDKASFMIDPVWGLGQYNVSAYFQVGEMRTN